jgi:hypothetical protein
VLLLNCWPDLGRDPPARPPRGLRARGAGEHDPSGTQHRHAVGRAQRFVQLVGDEHRGASLSGEGAKAAEHLVRLRRRQHRRGLVEQQNRGVGGQRPEDLESLPGADGQTARPHIGIERKAHAGRQVPYAVTELAWPGDAPACRERDVLRHGQSWYRR